MMALEAFADAEADADQMLMSDLASEATVASAGGPASLAEYCSGKGEEEAKMVEGTRVKADWNEYGTKYPGKVTEVNKDGTVDVHYNDGFDEKNIDPDDIRIRKPRKAGSFIDKLRLAKVKGPADDPACKMQSFLKNLQDQLKKVNGMLSKWLGAQRAKMAEDDEVPTPPPPTVTAAPPAAKGTTGAPPSQDQAGELEKLKKELGDLDTYIKQLEEKEAEYDQKIQDKKNPGLAGAPAAAPGVKTVDDLIAEYIAKIAQRNARVKELLQRIKEQKAELARLGQGQLSLKDIDAAIDMLEKEVEEGKKKRDELKKAGDLDPELRAVIDDIIKAFSKMRKKVDNLIALNVKAKAERVKAEQEAKEAALAAKKKAKEEGKSAAEAEVEAAAAVKKAKEKARKADLDTMNAANEVNEDLKKAEHSATELDTGLHPHGDKWWRYRYERSYIEAMLMCFISFLMVLWSVFWRQAKHRIHTWSLPVDATPRQRDSNFEELEEESIDCMYSTWLHFLADQMLVCIFVFLTVWLMAKTSLVDLFPMVIKPASDLHVPHTGEEYRKMALDICTIFFFAIVFYFGLMFSVASSMERTMRELNMSADDALPPYSFFGRLAHLSMGSMERLGHNIPTFHKYFVSHISSQMSARDDPELKEISGLLNDDFNNFPLAKYLKMNVWVNGIQLFVFGWGMWLPVIAQFMCLMLLHRFAHMGYIRIMGFATVVVLLMICGMGQINKHLLARIRHHDEQYEHTQHEHPPSVLEKYNTENIVLGLLQFSLFFVCYGVARMICQPWMWELHFWPVFVLTIVAILGACLFVTLVAPSIPSFLCAMAMPPYVSPRNTQVMKVVAISYNKPRARGTSKNSPRFK